MFRRSPRAVISWLAATVVAVVTATFVANDLAAIHQRARRLGVERTVVVATRDLTIGTSVSRRSLETRRVHDGVPPGAIASPARAVGRVVVVPILRGEVLGARHLAAAGRRGLDGVVPRGRRAVRVVVDDGIRPPVGGSVDVFATYDPSKVTTGNDPTVVVVAGARVVGVDDPDGAWPRPSSRHLGVTLLATPEQVRRLAFARGNAVLTLALVPPEDARAGP